MKATFYVQFQATHSTRGDVVAVKATRLTQGRPFDPEGGAALARLTVDVPEHVFQPLEVEGALQAEQVEVIPAAPEPVEEDDRG